MKESGEFRRCEEEGGGREFGGGGGEHPADPRGCFERWEGAAVVRNVVDDPTDESRIVKRGDPQRSSDVEPASAF